MAKKPADFTDQLLDLIEANQEMHPSQVFGEMIQLAVKGLYDMSPNYPTAQAVINTALSNGLQDHAESIGMQSNG